MDEETYEAKFMLWAHDIRETLEDPCDEGDCVRAIFDSPNAYAYQIKRNYWPKLLPEFERLKALGDKQFKAKLYDKALVAYNKAIVHADTAKALYTLWFNRSAFFEYRKRYKLAIYDSIDALGSGFKGCKTAVLHSRIEACLAKLGMEKEKTDFQNDRSKTMLKSLVAVLEKKKEIQRKLPEKLETCLNWDFPRNPRNPALSLKVQIEEVPDLGRGVVALEDIKVGEFVIREKPFLTSTNSKVCGTEICHHCFRLIAAAHSCPRCSFVAFCSHSCLSAATYHVKYECFLLQIFDIMGDEVTASMKLAFRLLTQSSLAEIVTGTRNAFRTDFDVDSEGTEIEKFLGSEWHPEHPMNLDDLTAHNLYFTIYYILDTMRDLRYFKGKTKFPHLPPSRSSKLNAVEFHIAKCLVRAFRVLNYNVLSVPRRMAKPYPEDQSTDQIGKLVLNTINRLNHSCDANVAVFYVGLESFVVSLRPIKKGEQVVYSYYSQSFGLPQYMRQSVLMNGFDFLCKCLFCHNPPAWCKQAGLRRPDIGISDFKRYICNNCMATVDFNVNCPSCGTPVPTKEFIYLIYEVIRLQFAGIRSALLDGNVEPLIDGADRIEQMIVKADAMFGSPSNDGKIVEVLYSKLRKHLAFIQEESLDY